MISRRAGVVIALAEKFKEINGTSPYNINLFNNSFPKLKFWDEVNDFPAVFLVAGGETREYLPGDFQWGYLNISIKLYTKGENSLEDLELLIQDVETAIDSTKGILIYDNTNGYETSQFTITSITTDEGLLAPYSVGEVNLLVRYQVM